MSLDYMSYPDPDFTQQDAIREACKMLKEQSVKLERVGCSTEADNLSWEADKMMKQYRIQDKEL